MRALTKNTPFLSLDISVLILISSLCTQVAFAQSADENFVVSETMLGSTGSSSVKSVQYFDGLGRASILSLGGQNTSGKYLYSLVEYDSNGRELRTWLPSVGGSVPDIITSANMRTLSDDTYGTGQYAYSEISYDALGREVFRGTPGKEWYEGNRGLTTDYITNEANSIKRYKMPLYPTISLSSPTVTYYEAGELTGVRYTDADHHTMEVYRDMLGNVVLERRKMGAKDLDTYYAYDAKCQLRAVIPPGFTVENAYRYEYDSHGRCVKKILPGDVVFQYWYDKYGRLSFMRNARLKDAGKYRFFSYDGLNRLAVQGTTSSAPSRMGKNYEASVVLNGSGNSLLRTGYSLKDGTLEITDIEIVNYYDGYAFWGNSMISDDISNEVLFYDNLTCATTLMTGQVVGTSEGGYLYRLMYYDDKGRCIEQRESNPEDNKTWIRTSTTYSFTGKPLSVIKENIANDKKLHTIQHTCTYDASSDLLLSESLQLDEQTPVLLQGNRYNDLGQVAERSMGNEKTLRESFAYDVHGWLKSHHFFDEKLHYTPVFTESLHYASGGATPCYNGNISAVEFKSDGNPYGFMRKFDYSYDELDRVVRSDYSESSPTYSPGSGLSYSERFTYNDVSAITRLVRYGQNYAQGHRMVDSLSYQYDGMRLTRIDDHAGNWYVNGASEFTTLGSDHTYSFDASGSLVSDGNKGIAQIDYDVNGYAQRIQFSNGNVNEYVHAADGRKLRATYKTAVPGLSVSAGERHTLSESETQMENTVRYVDGFEVLNNWNCASYFYGNGYLDCDTYHHYNFHFFAKDRLGNTRGVFYADGSLENVYNYQTYGNDICDYRNRFELMAHKYNGKEFDHRNGLNLYDYGARLYDPIFGLFTSIDPLCEKYYHINPYTYCMGNPVKYVDPDGRDVWEINDQGEIINRIKDNTQDAFYMVAKDVNGNYQRTFTTDSDGNKSYNSISFKYATVVSQRTTAISFTDSYDIYIVRGDANGTQLFEMMSQHTTVEWSQAKTGIAGEKGLNFLTTSHDESKERGMSNLYSGQLHAGYTIRELNHSHPRNTGFPSGSFLHPTTGQGIGEWGDVSFARSITHNRQTKGLNIPTFGIFLPASKRYIVYSPNSIRSNYER